MEFERKLLETGQSGLVCRPLRSTDAAAIFERVDANRERLREWLPWLDQCKEISGSEFFVADSIRAWDEGKAARFVLDQSGAIVGSIALEVIDEKNRSAKIGYWCCQTVEGQGKVPNATRAILKFAFDDLDLHLVSIHTARENKRSQSIPTALGFRSEGILRERAWLYDRFVDMAIYSVTQMEWRRLS